MSKMTETDRERAMEEYIVQIQRVKKNAQAVVSDLEELEQRARSHRSSTGTNGSNGPAKPPS